MNDAVAQAPPSQFNLAAHLLARNASRAARIAYADDRTRLSYGELAKRMRQFARVLHEHGVRPEERVLLLAHDTVDWPVAFLGCIYAGVVPVAVNTLLTADDYAYMLGHSRARAAIVSQALLPMLAHALGREGHAVETVWVIDAKGELASGQRDSAAAALIDHIPGSNAGPRGSSRTPARRCLYGY